MPYLETIEKDHGRIEIRRYWVAEEIGWFADKNQWDGLRSFGMVESLREVDGKQTCEIRFFLASIAADAKAFARAVRGHWSVENSLHCSHGFGSFPFESHPAQNRMMATRLYYTLAGLNSAG